MTAPFGTTSVEFFFKPTHRKLIQCYLLIIASQLELRPVISVYHHVRRIYDLKARQGKWTLDEDAVLEWYVTHEHNQHEFLTAVP